MKLSSESVRVAMPFVWTVGSDDDPLAPADQGLSLKAGVKLKYLDFVEGRPDEDDDVILLPSEGSQIIMSLTDLADRWAFGYLMGPDPTLLLEL